MGYCISTRIQLPFGLLENRLRIEFVNDFELRLVGFVEDGKENFAISPNPVQRLASLVRRLFEHPIKLTTSALLAGKIFIED